MTFYTDEFDTAEFDFSEFDAIIDFNIPTPMQNRANLPHGLEEPVPARLAGVKDPYLYLNRLQDDMTEKRRAHYGEDPAFEMKLGETANVASSNVNDVKTTRNTILNSDEFDVAEFDNSEFDVEWGEQVPTMLEQIRLSTNETSYSRASTQ